MHITPILGAGACKCTVEIREIKQVQYSADKLHCVSMLIDTDHVALPYSLRPYGDIYLAS